MPMKRSIVRVMLGVLLLSGSLMGVAMAAEPKVIQTHKAKDVVISLLSESGQLSKGKNAFILQFASATTNQPLDVGKVTLNTNMSMPGMAPMVADAALSADKTPGRYLGTISFPDSGTRQVTVTWDGPAGKGSTRFSVPVR
jgi:multidrug efflux pump subunit AcrA (membrane-fusion protein)